MTFFSVIFEDGVLTTLAVCYLPCSENKMSITRLKTDSPPQVCPQAYRSSQKNGVSFDLYQDLNVYVKISEAIMSIMLHFSFLTRCS